MRALWIARRKFQTDTPWTARELQYMKHDEGIDLLGELLDGMEAERAKVKRLQAILARQTFWHE